MRVTRRAIQVLVLCFLFTVTAGAQLDSAAWRAKLGTPLNRDTFRMPAGFDLIVDYGANGQACRLQVPALMPTTEQVANAAVMKQRMYDFLADLVPYSIRGTEVNRGVMSLGAVSIIFIEYEKVTINELQAGEPFSNDSHITITFKANDCRSQ